MAAESESWKPNPFILYAKHLADAALAEGKPFRKVEQILNTAAGKWAELPFAVKKGWHKRSKAVEIPPDGPQCSSDYLRPSCSYNIRGLYGDVSFWTKHWMPEEKIQCSEEVELLEKFDDLKRPLDRKKLVDMWNQQKETGNFDIRNATFMVVSVQAFTQSTSDTECCADTMAIGTFCLSDLDGSNQHTQFCCGVAPASLTDRRENSTNYDMYINIQDGCHVRRCASSVAKLIFQRCCKNWNDAVDTPIFFCMAKDYADVYETLSYFKKLESPGGTHLSVHCVVTVEDLMYALLTYCNVPRNFEGNMLFQRLFDEQFKEELIRWRCVSHTKDDCISCPLSNIRMCSWLMKTWTDFHDIPVNYLDLILFANKPDTAEATPNVLSANEISVSPRNSGASDCSSLSDESDVMPPRPPSVGIGRGRGMRVNLEAPIVNHPVVLGRGRLVRVSVLQKICDD